MLTKYIYDIIISPNEVIWKSIYFYTIALNYKWFNKNRLLRLLSIPFLCMIEDFFVKMETISLFMSKQNCI